MITINPHRCPQNHPCPLIDICPKKAISQKGYGLPTVNHSECIDCGLCTKYCPTGAVTKS